MNKLPLQSELEALYQRQKENWPAFSEAVEGLSQIQSKTLDVVGAQIVVQNNPARIRSTAAKTDEKSLAERACFLCEKNRPAEQEGVDLLGGKYLALVNPFPVLPMHFTVVGREHILQEILPALQDFLEVSSELGPESALIFNGAKAGASAPDHVHFQIIPTSALPIHKTFAPIDVKQGSPVIRNFAGANFIVYKSRDRQSLYKTLTQALESLQKVTEISSGLINLIAWSEGENLTVVLTPRKTHRPRCFYAEGSLQLLVSPAAIELSGVWVLPRFEDFEKITPSLVELVNSEVCLSENQLKRSILA